MATAIQEDDITTTTSGEILQYETDATMNDASDIEEEPVKRRRGAALTYIHLGKFETKAEAIAAMEGKWSILKTETGGECGVKINYKCSEVRGSKCPCRMYILLHADDDSFSLFTSDREHTHDVDGARQPITIETKAKITELYTNGVTKPQLILNALTKQGITQPRKSMLTAFLKTLKKQLYGKYKVSLGEFKERVEPLTAVPGPEQMDKMFVSEQEIAQRSRKSGFSLPPGAS